MLRFRLVLVINIRVEHAWINFKVSSRDNDDINNNAEQTITTQLLILQITKNYSYTMIEI